MSVRLIITVDTEEDAWGRYDVSDPTVENVSHLLALQNLFDRYGAIATYLINWPVVSNPKARSVLHQLLDKGFCEIGTHCHPWNTPPIEEKANEKNALMLNLPYDLVIKKLEKLHAAIVSQFGITPLSFRAGRWGFGPEVARAILKLGYRIDSSLTPFAAWFERDWPAFWETSAFAFGFDPDKVLCRKAVGCLSCGQADGCILEVPPSIGFFQKNFKLCNSIRNQFSQGPFSKFHILGILEKFKLLNRRWISPELTSTSEMIRLAKSFIKTGHRFINMTFHSTSLLPGKSPFVSNRRQLDIFLHRIESFLKFAVDKGLKFSPLSQVLEILR